MPDRLGLYGYRPKQVPEAPMWNLVTEDGYQQQPNRVSCMQSQQIVFIKIRLGSGVGGLCRRRSSPEIRQIMYEGRVA